VFGWFERAEVGITPSIRSSGSAIRLHWLLLITLGYTHLIKLQWRRWQQGPPVGMLGKRNAQLVELCVAGLLPRNAMQRL
jgi:hypothetical protein